MYFLLKYSFCSFILFCLTCLSLFLKLFVCVYLCYFVLKLKMLDVVMPRSYISLWRWTKIDDDTKRFFFLLQVWALRLYSRYIIIFIHKISTAASCMCFLSLFHGNSVCTIFVCVSYFFFSPLQYLLPKFYFSFTFEDLCFGILFSSSFHPFTLVEHFLSDNNKFLELCAWKKCCVGNEELIWAIQDTLIQMFDFYVFPDFFSCYFCYIFFMKFSFDFWYYIYV